MVVLSLHNWVIFNLNFCWFLNKTQCKMPLWIVLWIHMWVAGRHYLNPSHNSYVQHRLAGKWYITDSHLNIAYSGLDIYMPQYCDAMIFVISCHHHKVIMRFTWSSAYTYIYTISITLFAKCNSPEHIPEAGKQCLSLKSWANKRE